MCGAGAFFLSHISKSVESPQADTTAPVLVAVSSLLHMSSEKLGAIISAVINNY